ncbi:AAA family ATPase [Ligilactobacillus equi]|uniref:Exodeoxyribonuclease V alpha subunit n=1 Tax=Ligilactobacillus equi DSM 15833 = JCM 10991 TaxID=1423740 RepID=A0A0R1TC50_9LACO|nr:AAA family ATPase [Ligilactobacillus equi]KRL78254.1 exodeoxyribonuclease V alpha subunit [Ligilactobacillus equi DSM 15833 = JCM 10991]
MTDKVMGKIAKITFSKGDFRIYKLRYRSQIYDSLNDKWKQEDWISVMGDFPELDEYVNTSKELIFDGYLEYSEQYNNYTLKKATYSSVDGDTPADVSKLMKQTQVAQMAQKAPNNGNDNPKRKYDKYTLDRLVNFFSSDTFEGIGEKAAKTLVSELGGDALQKITKDLTVIDKTSLNKKQKASLKDAFEEDVLPNSALATLSSWGMTSNMITKIKEFYRYDKLKSSKKKVASFTYKNVYKFTEVPGISFLKIDKVAQAAGYAFDDRRRIAECLVYSVTQSLQRTGDTYVQTRDLLESVPKDLRSNWQSEIPERYLAHNTNNVATKDGEDSLDAKIKEVMQYLKREKKLAFINDNSSNDKITTYQMFKNENYIVKAIFALLEQEDDSLTESVDDFLEELKFAIYAEQNDIDIDSLTQEESVNQNEIDKDAKDDTEADKVDEETKSVTRMDVYARANEAISDEQAFNKLIDIVEDDLNLQYAEEQRQAIVGALTHRFFIITGGPGTGKTSVLNGIMKAYSYIFPEVDDSNDYVDEINDMRKQWDDYLKSLEDDDPDPDNVEGIVPPPVTLVAPTGRAAQRMKESTQLEAATIHRRLKLRVGSKSPDISFSGRLVVIDETSMVDTSLMSVVLSALKDDMRILLIGDSDQLPSVGPGQVLSDILRSDIVPYVRLTKIFRQGEGSRIVNLAKSVNSGSLPSDFSQVSETMRYIPVDDSSSIYDSSVNPVVESDSFNTDDSNLFNDNVDDEMVANVMINYEEVPADQTMFSNANDYFGPDERSGYDLIPNDFLPIMPNNAVEQMQPMNVNVEPVNADEFAMNSIVQVVNEMRAQGYTEDDIQILSPMHKYKNGTDNLNEVMRKIFNPKSSDDKVVEFAKDKTFHVGDKVMNRVNYPDLGIYNGDIGKITSILPDETVLVEFKYGNGEIIEKDYPYSDLAALTLAYATTIHKSQGSEYPIVIIPMIHQFQFMFARNLLYTAITRAKQKIILVGQYSAFQQCSKRLGTNRKTMLVDKIRAMAKGPDYFNEGFGLDLWSAYGYQE